MKELTPHPSVAHCISIKLRRQEGISSYIIQVVFENALEIGFLVGQYFLYGFSVEGCMDVTATPVSRRWNVMSRPTEKTVFLVFMFAVASLSCVVLNLAELNHLG